MNAALVSISDFCKKKKKTPYQLQTFEQMYKYL